MAQIPRNRSVTQLEPHRNMPAVASGIGHLGDE